MPGFLLHQGAAVICAHGGNAQPAELDSRVRVGGLPVATQRAPYMVSGCPFVPPHGNGPCVSAGWLTAAARIRISGTPVVLTDSKAICTPTGAPLVIVGSQTRVRGT